MKRVRSVQATPFYYGWVIVAVSLVTVTLSSSMRSSFSVFYVAILRDFGWGRAESAGAMSLAMMTAAVGGLGAGWLVDRLGPRRLIPLGAVLLSLGLLASSSVHELWQLYVSFGLLTAGGVACLWYVPQGVLLSRWFVARRSTAFGIALSGIGIGSLIIVPLAQELIDAIGWRHTYLVLAALVAIVLIPLNGVLLRSSPQEIGLQPDGGQEPGETRGRPSRGRTRMVVKNPRWAATEWSVPLATRTYRFWLLLLINLCNGFRINLMSTHQVAYLVDKGFSAMLAAVLFGLTYLWGILGSICWGLVSDRYGREVAQSGLSACMIVGVFWLAAVSTTGDWLEAGMFALVFGLGMGGSTPVGTSIQADLFQGKQFGTILGTLNMGYGLGGALGAWFGGYVYDTTGSYGLALDAVILATFLSGTLVWVLAPRKVRAPARVPAGVL